MKREHAHHDRDQPAQAQNGNVAEQRGHGEEMKPVQVESRKLERAASRFLLDQTNSYITGARREFSADVLPVRSLRAPVRVGLVE